MGATPNPHPNPYLNPQPWPQTLTLTLNPDATPNPNRMAVAPQIPDVQSSDLLREAEKLEIQMYNLIIFKY